MQISATEFRRLRDADRTVAGCARTLAVPQSEVVRTVSALADDCERLAAELAALPGKTVYGHTVEVDGAMSMQVTAPKALAGFVGSNIMDIADEATRHLGPGVFIVIVGH